VYGEGVPERVLEAGHPAYDLDRVSWDLYSRLALESQVIGCDAARDALVRVLVQADGELVTLGELG
jgi:hypothetical protein